jgi:hypothetical protein
VIYFLACYIPATSLNLVLISLSAYTLNCLADLPILLRKLVGSVDRKMKMVKRMGMKGIRKPRHYLNASDNL